MSSQDLIIAVKKFKKNTQTNSLGLFPGRSIKGGGVQLKGGGGGGGAGNK